MNFFSRLFGTRKAAKAPEVYFGRYTDAYKTAVQYDAWDESQEYFEAEKYTDAYASFLDYLNDPEIDNVRYEKSKEGLNFEFFQGSKKIEGFANKNQVVVEAKIAQTHQLDAAFMERLIRRNFDLKYARFALDESNILTIKFDTYTLDGSPYKLYYALKELATNADKQDDLLEDEFKNITLVGVDHLKEISEKEKKIKYSFFTKKIKTVVNTIVDHGKTVEEYPGGLGYHLLNTAYKLDYLISPEGFMMEALERIHRLYFSKDDRTMKEKVAIVRSEFKILIERPAEDYYREMYLTTSTFGITNPASHDRVRSFIDGELGNMKWFQQNSYYDTALAVPGYIVGYCLFNYAIPLPDRAFFHLYYQIMEPEYFSKLGFLENYYEAEKKAFNKKEIRRAIRNIVKTHRQKFPKLNPDISSLDFSECAGFAKSYLLMVRNLNMIEVQ